MQLERSIHDSRFAINVHRMPIAILFIGSIDLRLRKQMGDGVHPTSDKTVASGVDVWNPTIIPARITPPSRDRMTPTEPQVQRQERGHSPHVSNPTSHRSNSIAHYHVVL